jgi:hypothetical protein
MEDNMKKLNVICWVAISFLATQVLAGNLTVNGNLTVTTNLTADSISLGGVTQTNWNSLPLQGCRYVIVPEGTNDLERGSNLQTAYTTATTLDPTSSNRVVVLVPPGSYNLGTSNLVVNTSYVDLIGLVPAQMTAKAEFTDSYGTQHYETIANVQCPVIIYANASAGTLVQNVDYVRIESVILTNTGSGVAYNPSVEGANTVMRHVSMSSMQANNTYAGEYIDCVSGGPGFGGSSSYTAGTASGTFIDCVGGNESFAGSAAGPGPSGGEASGTFIDCTGGNFSFAGGEGEANGTFRDCVGGSDSFAGTSGTADGTFIGCVGGDNSFGGYDGGASQDIGTASGTFVSCVGGVNSFAGDGTASGTFVECAGGDGSFAGASGGGGFGTASGTFINCVGSVNSFGGDNLDGGTVANSAKLQHCNSGTGSFGSYNIASQDFSYNVGGTNTFLMLPQLPTPSSTNGLPSGTVYNSSGSLKVMP